MVLHGERANYEEDTQKTCAALRRFAMAMYVPFFQRLRGGRSPCALFGKQSTMRSSQRAACSCGGETAALYKCIDPAKFLKEDRL